MLKALSMLTFVTFFVSYNALAGSTACDQIFAGQVDSAVIAKKVNFQLARLLAQAEASKEDFKTIQITGVMKTSIDIQTAEQAAELFDDETVLIRAVIKAGSSNIITFQASLAGVVNAASKNSVLVMNMSQRMASASPQN